MSVLAQSPSLETTLNNSRMDSSKLNIVESTLRNRELSIKITDKIRKLAPLAAKRAGVDIIKIMDFCGTHEWTVTHYGLRSLMPPEVELVAGPGCPVCITPAYYVDVLIKLSLEGVRVYTYGDAYRLPGSGKRGKELRSLEEARAAGGDVAVVYSFLDAIRMARKDKKPSVFFAIGFETTAPATAGPVVHGIVPDNLKILNVHRLTPPIMRYTFTTHKENPIKGVIAPGHVSTIVGAKAWEFAVKEYGIPTVVAGFEPIDVLLAILEILKQHVEGKPRLVNEYKRAVTWEGNKKAQKLINECCEVVDAAWRGIGFVPNSGLAFREKYHNIDAMHEYGIKELTPEEWKYDLPPGCRCAEVTLGIAKPTDCPLFMKVCTPGTPYGPCMVSSEGACSVWARFGGGGLAEEIAKSLGIV